MKFAGSLQMVAMMVGLMSGACLTEEEDLASIEQASCSASGEGCATLPVLQDFRTLPIGFDFIPGDSKRFFVLYERGGADSNRFIASGVDVTAQKIVWRISAARTEYDNFNQRFGKEAAAHGNSILDFSVGSAGGPGIKVPPKGPGGTDWKATWTLQTATDLSKSIDTAYEW